MQQDDVIDSKNIYCLRHKKEKVTHICIEVKCSNNPLLCPQCFNENVSRSYHYDHEKNILLTAEAVDKMCAFIRNQGSSNQKIYKATLGKSEFAGILHQLEGEAVIRDELEERINTIKSQVELELELLVKQFQKVLLLEKQEYFKLLDNYQRSYTKNMDYLKTKMQPLLDYQNSIKYYGNKNNFYLKLASEIQKKSDWFSKTKKSLSESTKNIDNSNYTSEVSNLLSTANKTKLDIWPTWKGEENSQKTNELRYYIKRAMNQWAYIPELKYLGDSESNGNSGAGISKNYYVSSNGK